MQNNVNPVVAGVVIVIVVAIALFFGWRAVGGPAKVRTPVDMSKMMGQGKMQMAPPTNERPTGVPGGH